MNKMLPVAMILSTMDTCMLYIAALLVCAPHDRHKSSLSHIGRQVVMTTTPWPSAEQILFGIVMMMMMKDKCL